MLLGIKERAERSPRRLRRALQATPVEEVARA